MSILGNNLFWSSGLLPQDRGHYGALEEKVAQCVAAHLLYFKNIHNNVRRLWNISIYGYVELIAVFEACIMSVSVCFVPEDKITTAEYCTSSDCEWRRIFA